MDRTMHLMTLKLRLANDAYVVDPQAVAMAMLRDADPRTAILPVALSRPSARAPAGGGDRPGR